MKKFMSKIIIFIIFFSIIVPYFNFVSYGGYSKDNINKIEIKPSFTKSLKEGGVNTTPSDVMIQDIKPNTILLSLGIKNIKEIGATTIYYLKSKDEKVTFTIEPFGDLYKAKYEIYLWKNNDWIKKESNFEVYSGNSSTPKYYDIETYKKEYNSKTHGISEDSTDKNVTFIFGKSKGFSFKDNERIIHFRVSNDANNIDIVFDNIKEGYIYNFYAESEKIKGNTSVFTGINTSTFDSIPFSTNHLEDIDNKNNDEILNFKNDKYILNYKNGELTAKEEVGISIRFDEPMSLWIDTEKKGEPNCTPTSKLKDNNIEYLMSTSIRMLDNRTGSTKNDQLKIKIKDIISLTEERTEIEIENSKETTPKPHPEKDGSFVRLLTKSKEEKPGRIELRLNGLKPGTLFSNVEVESEVKLKSGEEILSKNPKEIQFGKVFTFLEYKFIYRSNAFFIEVLPYKGIKGLYSLVMNNNIILQQIGDYTKNIYLCLPLTTKETYQIYFAPERNLEGDGSTNLNKMTYSEKSIYKPDGSDMNFDAPTDFKILEHNLRALDSYPNSSLYGTEGILSMKLHWSIGRSEDIREMIEISKDNTLNVKYNINKSLLPEKEKVVPFAKSFLNIKKVSENNYEVLYTVKDLKTEEEIDSGKYILKEIDGKYYIETKFEIKAKRSKEKVQDEEKDMTFYYPRIYFLNISVDSKSSKYSLFDSLTLDDILSLKLPNPNNLKQTENTLTKDSFEINWKHSGKELLKFMKNNSYGFDKGKIKFFVNLYISQDIEKIKEISKLDKIEDRKKYSVNFNFKEMGTSPISFKGEPIKNLRQSEKESKVLRIEGFDINNYRNDIESKKDFIPKLNLKDLDINQKYYLNVSLGLKYESEDGSIIEIESIMSNILAITTKDEEKIPGDEDKIPYSPKIFIKDIGLDKATIFWKYVDLPKEDSNVKVNYQIIRTKNKQIDSKYLNTYNDISFYYKSLEKDLPDTQKVFLETNYRVNKEGKYAPDIFDGNSFKQAEVSKFEIKYENINLELLDNTLSSNQIYFYYVRTVRIVGNKIKYSAWSVENCTTSNLKSPINLSIETERNDYDPKSEFIIKFDAPIKNLEILGKEYILQYSIKEEDEEFSEAVDMDCIKLKQNSSKSKIKDYTNFIYKISGLKSNKNYAIKVRLKSLTSGDTSAYSNIEITRTDMSQDDYENNKDIEKWIDYFKEELEKLKKYPYWIINDNKSEFAVVYRQNMFENIINANTDSIIELVKSSKSPNIYEYYIPYKNIIEAIKYDKSFKIYISDTDIIIPSKVFNQDNDEIIKLSCDIKNKKIEDIYIKIKIEENKYNKNIDNYKALTNKVDINFEVVGSIISNLKWDKDIIYIYSKEINNQTISKYIKNYIKESIIRNKSNEEIIKYISERVWYIKDSILHQINNSFNRSLKTKYCFNKLYQDIIIILKNSSNKSIIKAFLQNNNLVWLEKDIINFGEYKGINTNMTGSYIFAGKNLIIPGIDKKPNANIITKIVSKYNLDDILGKDGFINTESIATRDVALDITARMIGASKKNNSAKFLSSKGYDIINLNNKGTISLQEYIYLIMAIYETRTNTNIDTIYIRNNTSLDNIKDIDKKYEKSLKAALELGLYEDIDTLQPKSKLTIKQILEILTNLDTKSYL